MRFHLVVFVSSCRSGRETDQNNEGKTHTYFNWKIFLSSRPSQLSRSMGRWTFSGAQADIFPETTILCAPVWLCLQGGDLHISAVFWNLQHFLVVESTASSIFLHFPSLTFNHRQAETDTDVCISLGCEKMQEFSFFVAKTYAIFEFSTFFDFFSKKISIFFVPSRAMCVSGVRRPSAISCAPERASFFSFEMKFWNFREFSWFFAVFWYCSDEISRVPPNWELRLGMWLISVS